MEISLNYSVSCQGHAFYISLAIKMVETVVLIEYKYAESIWNSFIK